MTQPPSSSTSGTTSTSAAPTAEETAVKTPAGGVKLVDPKDVRNFIPPSSQGSDATAPKTSEQPQTIENLKTVNKIKTIQEYEDAYVKYTLSTHINQVEDATKTINLEKKLTFKDLNKKLSNVSKQVRVKMYIKGTLVTIVPLDKEYFKNKTGDELKHAVQLMQKSIGEFKKNKLKYYDSSLMRAVGSNMKNFEADHMGDTEMKNKISSLKTMTITLHIPSGKIEKSYPEKEQEEEEQQQQQQAGSQPQNTDSNVVSNTGGAQGADDSGTDEEEGRADSFSNANVQPNTSGTEGVTSVNRPDDIETHEEGATSSPSTNGLNLNPDGTSKNNETDA